MSAVYNCESWKENWWGEMPGGFTARVNKRNWNREHGMHIPDDDEYTVELFYNGQEIDAIASIHLRERTKVCLFIGQALENHAGVKRGDFIIACADAPQCRGANGLTTLWRPYPDWMKNISGSKLLSEINIPGTHDSCANYSGLLERSVRCQNLDLPTQLYSGIRFLDIRCRHVHNHFNIHHGAYFLDMTFDGVIGNCKRFLHDHPNETIILCVKKEHTDAGNTRSFEDTLKDYMHNEEELWYTKNVIPKLEEVRGKIILLRRYEGELGLDASEWQDNTVFTLNDSDEGSDKSVNRMRVQDVYNMTYTKAAFNNKWERISSLMNEAKKGHPKVMYINFSSGSTAVDPCDVANGGGFKYGGMNKRLEEYLQETNGRIGIIVMDFFDYENNRLVPLIVESN